MSNVFELFPNEPVTQLADWQLHRAAPFVHHSQESLEASISIHPSVGSLRERVFELLKTESLTDEQIAKKLNLNPSTARPRRIELVNAGLVENVGTAKTASGRNASMWRAVPTKMDS